MAVYYDEPKSAAELINRYREVKRRLYPVPTHQRAREVAVQHAETSLSFIVAFAGALAEQARQSERKAEALRGVACLCSPGDRARAALRAVANRTGVSIDQIMSRKKRARSPRRGTRPFGASTRSQTGRSSIPPGSSPAAITPPSFIRFA